MLNIFHIVFNTIFLDEVPSTNDYAMELLTKSNPNEGTVISTHKQGAGKGQIGRSWFSDQDQNLSLSLILRPCFVSINDRFYISMMLALAVREFIEEEIQSSDVSIKWPNDIYVGNKKIAGLLIQQSIFKKRISSCVLGIGINANQKTFPEQIPNPISIFQLTQEESDLFILEKKLLEKIEQYYTRLRKGEYNWTKRSYLSYLYKRGELSSFQKEDGSLFVAEIVGVDPSGKLVLKVDDQLEFYAMYEIKMKVEI